MIKRKANTPVAAIAEAAPVVRHATASSKSFFYQNRDKGRKMKGNNSTEDYLKCILSLQNERGSVRAVDIARTLKVSKPTVSVTVRKLYDQDLICFDRDGHIYLTIKGKDTAEKVNEKNILLMKVLKSIGVSEKTATEEACMIEHVIGEETYKCLERFYSRHGQTE